MKDSLHLLYSVINVTAVFHVTNMTRCHGNIKGGRSKITVALEKSYCREHTCQVLDLKIREIFRRPPQAVPPPQQSSSIPYILRQVL